MHDSLAFSDKHYVSGQQRHDKCLLIPVGSFTVDGGCIPRGTTLEAILEELRQNVFWSAYKAGIIARAHHA